LTAAGFAGRVESAEEAKPVREEPDAGNLEADDTGPGEAAPEDAEPAAIAGSPDGAAADTSVIGVGAPASPTAVVSPPPAVAIR
jgi:hypothetical protein